MAAEGFVFDLPHAQALTQARQAALEPLLRALRRQGACRALDVGCGVGYFAQWLRGLGYEVLGVEGRPENIQEARRRHPDIVFEVADVEDLGIRSLGAFDVVLCLGLLYHLENPVLALRNLRAVTGQVLIVETMVVPDRRPVLLLLDEGQGLDQSLRGFALYPSQAAVTAMLYRVGFEGVFVLPDPKHPDFLGSPMRRRARAMFAATDSSAIQKVGLAPAAKTSWMSDPWATALSRLYARAPSGVRNAARLAVRMLRGPLALA